jgi:hypothetical protein
MPYSAWADARHLKCCSERFSAEPVQTKTSRRATARLCRASMEGSASGSAGSVR